MRNTKTGLVRLVELVESWLEWNWKYNTWSDISAANLKQHIDHARRYGMKVHVNGFVDDEWDDKAINARKEQSKCRAEILSLTERLVSSAADPFPVLQVQTIVSKGGPAIMREHWDAEIKPKLLAQLASGQADSKTDKLPENRDVIRLAKMIRRERPKGRTKIDIALEFTEQNEHKANSLLRALRRYPALKL